MSSSPLYQPLSKGRREIRLLRIEDVRWHAGNTRPRISCSFLPVSLIDPPAYNALSYTWGLKEDGLETIWVNGQQFNAQINLYRALRALYHDFRGSWLWVDAVCINQDDIHEKAWQLELMFSIYSKAKLVIVWLGPAQDKSDLVIDKLRELGHRVLDQGGKQYLDHGEIKWVPLTRMKQEIVRRGVSQHFLEREVSKIKHSVRNIEHPDALATSAIHACSGEVPTFSDDLVELLSRVDLSDDHSSTIPWTPLTKFLSRPYWQRVWVVQELTVAQHVMFACGNKRITWPTFHAAMWAMDSSVGGLQMLAGDPSVLGQFREVHEILADSAPFRVKEPSTSNKLNASARFQIAHRASWQDATHHRFPLRELLVMASSPWLGEGIQATEKKDFIWALKGLSSDAEELGISWPQLYQEDNRRAFIEVARAIIRFDGSLKLLSYVTRPDEEHTGEAKNYGGSSGTAASPSEALWLPSWVPNWINRPKYLAPNFAKPLNDHLEAPFSCSGLSRLPNNTFSSDHDELLLEVFHLGKIGAVMDPAPTLSSCQMGQEARKLDPVEGIRQMMAQDMPAWFARLYRFCLQNGLPSVPAADIISTVLADQVLSKEDAAQQWVRLGNEHRERLTDCFKRIVLEDTPFQVVAGQVGMRAFQDPELINKVKASIISEIISANKIPSFVLQELMGSRVSSNSMSSAATTTIADAEWEIVKVIAAATAWKGYDSDNEAAATDVIGGDFSMDKFMRRLAMAAIQREYTSPTSTTQALQEWGQFLTLAQIQMDRRIIFTTDNNYLGLGPKHLQRGDYVVIAAGADVPFVIRPSIHSSSRVKYCEFVGECYVQGVMDGEWIRRYGKDAALREVVLF